MGGGDGGGGGWVCGLQVHNLATSWPNLQVRTCKNSIQIEFQVGPECGKIEFSRTGKNWRGRIGNIKIMKGLTLNLLLCGNLFLIFQNFLQRFPSRTFPQNSGRESRYVEEISNPPKSV